MCMTADTLAWLSEDLLVRDEAQEEAWHWQASQDVEEESAAC